jgi:phosphatidylglycerophosphatase A
MDRLKLALVSCGFLGCAPFMPGTFGTLGGVLFAWLLIPLAPFGVYALLLALLIYLATRGLGDWAEDFAGRKDPGIFVQDEVVGYLITVAWFGAPTYLALVVAFVVFRFFDILKPPPCHRLERVGKQPGGFWKSGDGILLDDVMAGVYGLIVMAVLRTFLLEPSAWTLGAG